MPPRLGCARARETVVEQAQSRNSRHRRPPPSERASGAARTADLMEEKSLLTVDDSEVVWLGDTRVPVEREGNQTPLDDRPAQFLVHRVKDYRPYVVLDAASCDTWSRAREEEDGDLRRSAGLAT